MKFAYLILAHKNPAQLCRLVQALDYEESIFLIHIDAKMPIKPFMRTFQNYSRNKIFFCPKRVDIAWGSYSMIEATMFLIQFLFELELKVDYVHLLSGQDYPVKRNKEIVDFFRNNNGKNFLDFFPLPDKRWPENGMSRIKCHWGVNKQKYLSYSNLEYKKQQFTIPSLPEDITFYGGSQWWSLHIDCARFIMDKYLKNDILFQFYRYTLVPDEMLFHTLILNSHFKDTVVNDNLRYIKWNSHSPHPEIITNDHLQKLLSEEKLFARKFEPVSDSTMLEQLDNLRENADISGRKTKKPLKQTHPAQKKWCVITAAGKTSLHRKWINENPDFDLHIIVYDMSYEEFKNDTNFITQAKGYKFKLVYDYLTNHPEIIDKYDYFFIPDDDILMNTSNIHRFFNYMMEYGLEIAQPALTNSYVSYPHTVRRSNSILRFTNFVEMMQPCFSRDALRKVLFTFNENNSGWGIDFHWGKLIDYRTHNMAVIDDVISIHTRPIQSNHLEELTKYLQKYNLQREVIANLK